MVKRISLSRFNLKVRNGKLINTTNKKSIKISQLRRIDSFNEKATRKLFDQIGIQVTRSNSITNGNDFQSASRTIEKAQLLHANQLRKKMRSAVNRGEGRRDIVRTSTGDLTSSDTGVILGFVRDELKSENPNSAFLVIIEGSVERSDRQYETIKEFPARLVKDVQDFFEEYTTWSNGYIGRNSDYSVNISTITLRIIPENGGGCRRGQEKINVFDDEVFKNPVASNNNCFFKCLQD